MKDRLHRVAFTRPVHVQWMGTPDRARRVLAGNLSRGGMFLRSDADVAPGTKLSLALEAKGHALPFAEAEVIWSTALGALAPDGSRLPGFGVKFVRFLHPRSTQLLDFLIHRKAAHLPPELANQQVGGDAADEDAPAAAAGSASLEARPPEDFMNTPIDELSGAENTSSPKWTLDLEPAADAPSSSSSSSDEIPIVSDEIEHLSADASGAAEAEGWFQEPDETKPPSALEAADSGARVGAAVVLVGFLAVVAIGLLWVIRRDATPADATAAAATATATATTETSDDAVDDAKPTVATANAGGATHEVALPPAQAKQPTVASGATHEVALPPAPAKTNVAAAEPKAAPSTTTTTPAPQAGTSTQTPAPVATGTATSPNAPAPAKAAPSSVASATPVKATSPKTTSPVASAPAASKKLALRAGAVQTLSLARAGKELTVKLELLRGTSIDRVFVLGSPNRAVIDLKGSAPKGSAKSAAGVPGVTDVRIGALPGGTRVVLDLAGPAASASVAGGVVHVQLK